MKNLQLFGVGMFVGTMMVMCTEAYAEENKITKWLTTEWYKTVEFHTFLPAVFKSSLPTTM